MDITGSFVLPDDIEIVPVAELPAPVRESIRHNDGDVAITRPLSRTTTRVVDAEGAELVKLFVEPKTIVAAVLDYSSRTDLDPHSMLEDAYVLVRRLLADRLIVQEGSEAAQPITPTLDNGASFRGFEIEACLQVLEDSEIYRVFQPTGERAALKLLRAPGRGEKLFEHEARLLAEIGPPAAPLLIEAGSHEGHSFIVLEWIDGEPLIARARRLQAASRKGRSEVAALGANLIEVYASLHQRGFLHGDVHPQNCLVEEDGRVRLIDFGYASAIESAADCPRAGVAFFFEPELAQAYRDGAAPPAASTLGEQYAVACLVYFALTGVHTQRFMIERPEMLRQIVEEPPLPFWKHNLRGWDNVESTLRIALAKAPRERFPDMSAFAASFRSAVAADTTAFETQDEEAILDEVVELVLRESGADDAQRTLGLDHPPTASVNYGAAGIAAALLHIGQAYDDANALSLAEAWSLRALLEADRETAFYNPEIDITTDTVGEVSLYHSATGVHLVRGLIAHAQGDFAAAQDAIGSFVEVSTSETSNLDLALGQSGILIGGAILRALPSSYLDHSALEAHCDAIAAQLWSRVEALPPVGQGEDLFLGMAHGWAGYLYAQLRWARAAGRQIPRGMRERLAQLAGLAETAADGLRWRWTPSGQVANYMAGWCNGSAGYVFLWALAHELWGGNDYLRLAEGAAVNAWREPGGIGNLCCGYAGRAYAALALFRATSDEVWLLRARELALDAVHAPQLQDEQSQAFEISSHSLYKGRVGVAALAADLRYPDRAAMPLFEAAPWDASAPAPAGLEAK